jgi:hypothetical protein
LPAGVEEHRIIEARTERGSLELFMPKPSVLVTRAMGHQEVSMAADWIRATESFLAKTESLVIFNEWRAMDSYDSYARVLLTDWTLAHRAKIECAWFLTSSRLVAMGVAAAAVATALAGVTIHASLSPVRWDQLLRERLAK